MKYYLDTEFIEGFHKPLFGKKRHFIDLISIGIVAEDGREYYAISKDFDLKEAWNSWEKVKCCNLPEICTVRITGQCSGYGKEYWIRENVLKNILNNEKYTFYTEINTFSEFKRLVNHFGKSNNQITEEIKHFLGINTYNEGYGDYSTLPEPNIEGFYAYYADYDWVVFCSLFGRMIDIPKGFPMYCKDLKQMLDEKAEVYDDRFMNGNESIDTKLSFLKNKDTYPKQQKEHNALADAKWNKRLHEFLIKSL